MAKTPTFVTLPDYLRPWAAGIIETEIHWYRDASGECPARVPVCYGGTFEDRTSYALLLEDLGGAWHPEPDRLLPAGSGSPGGEDTGAGACALVGKRQAAGLGVGTHDGAADGNQHTASPGRAGIMFAERIVPRVDPSFLPIGERLVRDWGTLFERGAASGATLIHGDFRIENFLFGERGTAGRDRDPRLAARRLRLGPAGSRVLHRAGVRTGQSGRRSATSWWSSTTPRSWNTGSRGYSFKQCLDDYRHGLAGEHVHPAHRYPGPRGPRTAAPGRERGRPRVLPPARTRRRRGLLALMAERSITAAMDANAGEVLGL